MAAGSHTGALAESLLKIAGDDPAARPMIELARRVGRTAKDGRLLELGQEPKWISQGSRTNFTDRVMRPFNDAGWRNTARTGGKPGEMGGLFWRDEPPWFLARPVGRLSLDQELSASGRIVMTASSADSAVYLGWFGAEAKTNRTPAEYGAPARNQLALLIEGPSAVGHYPSAGSPRGSPGLSPRRCHRPPPGR